MKVENIKQKAGNKEITLLLATAAEYTFYYRQVKEGKLRPWLGFQNF